MLSTAVDPFTAERLTSAVTRLEPRKAELHSALFQPEPYSEETQVLLDAADRAIERSRTIAAQAHEVRTACAAARRAQELRFIFLRGGREPR
jgi:hypothetical protein